MMRPLGTVMTGTQGPGGGLLYVRWFQVRQAGERVRPWAGLRRRACSPSARSLSHSSSQDELEGKPKATQQEEAPSG